MTLQSKIQGVLGVYQGEGEIRKPCDFNQILGFIEDKLWEMQPKVKMIKEAIVLHLKSGEGIPEYFNHVEK